eukprot:8745350-Pyramimonas_sp.AAC.1
MNVPIDDAVAGGPHSLAKRLRENCRAAGWPWAASSLRLHQNLKDIEAPGCDFRNAGYQYTAM